MTSPLMKENNDNVVNVAINQNEILLPQLKPKKLNSSFSADTFNDDPFHVMSLSHQNSLNVDDSQNTLNLEDHPSPSSPETKTPTRNNSFAISNNETTKTENPISSSTSNFVNMVLLPKKTPQKTPSSRRRNSMCGDRFIPNYSSGDKETQYNLAGPITPSKGKRRLPPGECDAVKEEQNKIYDSVVKIELLGQDMYDNSLDKINKQRTSVYSFKTPKKRTYQMMDADSPTQHKYSLTPMSQASQNLLLTPRKATRHISKTPYKVLDAPELQDDFYLNLVDWSSTNQLSVGLGSCVYLWSACNSRVTRLCDLGPFDSVTSVNWMQKGTHLAVGTNRGLVQLWDIQRGRKIRQFTGHQARVGSLAWNGDILTSGSRDRQILNRDIRVSNDYTKKYLGHKQEVCGLKWNYEENQLASGGNDNKLIIWDKSTTTPLYRFEDHVAAVKAVSWSPHQHGLLASGGGTADRKILFWNTLTGNCIQGIDTGSQVCNLSWSKTTNELVSTHGYSQNQIIIWKYPSLHQIATLIGHTYRVLYLAMSPDGQNIVTGAGDETLRFWNVFNKSKSKETQNGALSSFGHIR
jgi:cell division cycle 20-like protein 1 (cofactor of APC complex)